MHGASLEAALSDDPEVGHHAMALLRQSRDREELLRNALQVAEANEAKRLATARAELRKSQDRAIRQHISALVKDAGAYQSAIDNQVSAYRRMVRAGQSIGNGAHGAHLGIDKSAHV